MKSLEIPAGAVVVGIDGSRHSEDALDWAVRHGCADRRALVLLHASFGASAMTGPMVPGGVVPPAYSRDDDLAGQAILDHARASLEPVSRFASVHVGLVRDDPRSALLQASTHASLVVVGSHGRGPVRSLLLGSVGAAVAMHASCPVVVTRPHHPGQVRRGVLVAADGSAESVPVVEFAFRRAAEEGLPLTVAHMVWDTLGADDMAVERGALTLAESVAGFGAKFPDVAVQRTLLRGAGIDGLLALAETMHLVVVGHERTSVLGRLTRSSFALSVVEHAATAVAVVPQAETAG